MPEEPDPTTPEGYAEIRRRSMEETERALGALFREQFEEKLKALESIPDEVWATAEEADKEAQQPPPRTRKPKKHKSKRKYKGETIKMTCPLCGHASVTRYRMGGRDHYVCDGCKKAFVPEYWGIEPVRD
jgi:hypothetical protein